MLVASHQSFSQTLLRIRKITIQQNLSLSQIIQPIRTIPKYQLKPHWIPALIKKTANIAGHQVRICLPTFLLYAQISFQLGAFFTVNSCYTTSPKSSYHFTKVMNNASWRKCLVNFLQELGYQGTQTRGKAIFWSRLYRD